MPSHNDEGMWDNGTDWGLKIGDKIKLTKIAREECLLAIPEHGEKYAHRTYTITNIERDYSQALITVNEPELSFLDLYEGYYFFKLGTQNEEKADILTWIEKTLEAIPDDTERDRKKSRIRDLLLTWWYPGEWEAFDNLYTDEELDNMIIRPGYPIIPLLKSISRARLIQFIEWAKERGGFPRRLQNYLSLSFSANGTTSQEQRSNKEKAIQALPKNDEWVIEEEAEDIFRARLYTEDTLRYGIEVRMSISAFGKFDIGTNWNSENTISDR